VPFVQRLAGAKPFVIQINRNFDRLAHVSLPCLRYRRFAPEARVRLRQGGCRNVERDSRLKDAP
jgi:hypothetical protein